jgi:hypothetical protein
MAIATPNEDQQHQDSPTFPQQNRCACIETKFQLPDGTEEHRYDNPYHSCDEIARRNSFLKAAGIFAKRAIIGLPESAQGYAYSTALSKHMERLCKQ